MGRPRTLLIGGREEGGRKTATLKEAFKHDFMIGAAVTPGQFQDKDPVADPIIKSQFNSITPENSLKWPAVHPRPGVYDFSQADQYVSFGERNHMFIVGHNLVWHIGTPDWVFKDGKGATVSRDVLLERMSDHIHTVVGRYKGRIRGWDVVNEAVDNDGSLRKSEWLKIIGPDYIAKAFEFAHDADPSAELYYNDYALENPDKRAGAIALIEKLKKEQIPITGIGLQSHSRIDWPSAEQEDATISEFAKLGLKVMITEMDVSVLPRVSDSDSELNPYRDGLPEKVQQALAARYAELFRVFLKHRDVISRVTFWGVTDSDSWLNNSPVKGRTDYPLLFDREGRAKPAFYAVIGLLDERRGKL